MRWALLDVLGDQTPNHAHGLKPFLGRRASASGSHDYVGSERDYSCEKERHHQPNPHHRSRARAAIYFVARRIHVVASLHSSSVDESAPPTSHIHRVTTTLLSVKNFTASSPLACRSPKKLDFHPANGNTAIGAGTPTLIPTMPTCACVLNRRAE